jgi:hypothetical protein
MSQRHLSFLAEGVEIVQATVEDEVDDKETIKMKYIMVDLC